MLRKWRNIAAKIREMCLGDIRHWCSLEEKQDVCNAWKPKHLQRIYTPSTSAFVISTIKDRLQNLRHCGHMDPMHERLKARAHWPNVLQRTPANPTVESVCQTCVGLLGVSIHTHSIVLEHFSSTETVLVFSLHWHHSIMFSFSWHCSRMFFPFTF